MATSQIASMLDELMGRNRNFAPDDANARELRWTDSDICRYFLVQFCPHDLFTNTKADLGPCGKVHDDSLKVKFDEESVDNYKKCQYVDEFLRFCQRMLTDLSSRIKKAKERLILTQEKEERMLMASNSGSGGGATGGLNKEMDEKIILLSEKISALVQEAENAGCAGNVEQAQGLLKLSDQLREERDMLRRTANTMQTGIMNLKEEYAAQQKAMEVCDVCGAFLIVGDAQQRIDDHLLGKQHVGYARLRAAMDLIVEDKRKRREEREQELEDRRKKRDIEVRKSAEDRGGSGSGGGSSGRKRSRDRKDRRSHRSRSRDRERRRDRSRSGEARRRRNSSRERDSHRRRKSRSRERERRRERHRSRDKHRRRSPRSRTRSHSSGDGGRRDRRRDSKSRDRTSDKRPPSEGRSNETREESNPTSSSRLPPPGSDASGDRCSDLS